MPTLFFLCLVLTALSTLASFKPAHSPTAPAVYNNCSGDYHLTLPDGAASTPFFKPQIRVNPLDIDKNGTGWEEWFLLGHTRLPDGSEIVYSCKWALGDPTSANVSNDEFVVWAYFPNGTFYRQAVHDIFEYEVHADGGFTYSVADNHLTWDPTDGLWNTSVSIGGWIIETHTMGIEPDIPFAPNSKPVPGELSEGFFSRIEMPRGHTNGYMAFPWGLKITIMSVASLKHTWSNKAMGDALSAYVRGSTFFPEGTEDPISTVTWYQAWDPSGKEVDAMQFLLQPYDSFDGHVSRIQITDVPDILSIVTTPTPASLPLFYENTEITLPMCGPGADFKHTHEKMVWKTNNLYTMFEFVDLAGGVTLYQKVNITGVVWFDDAPTEIAGGVGVVEVYHR